MRGPLSPVTPSLLQWGGRGNRSLMNNLCQLVTREFTAQHPQSRKSLCMLDSTATSVPPSLIVTELTIRAAIVKIGVSHRLSDSAVSALRFHQRGQSYGSIRSNVHISFTYAVSTAGRLSEKQREKRDTRNVTSQSLLRNRRRGWCKTGGRTITPLT